MGYIICNKDERDSFLEMISEIGLSENDVVFIFDSAQLHKIFSTPVNSNGFVLINVEANLDKTAVADFYGFNIAADLRRVYKVRNQIVFYSHTYTDTYFEEKSLSDIKFKLLFGRGSSFIDFPYTVETLERKLLNTKTISYATLHDVVTMLCDLKGVVIDKLNHDLKFGVDIDSVIGRVTPYLSKFQKGQIKLGEFVGNLKKAKKQNEFNTLKLQFITLCNQQLTENEDNISQKGDAKYKVLILDDLQEEIDKAKENLKEHFIIEEALTGEEAISILDKDIKNEIIAVIADWRLFSDAKQNYWQSFQGYEVLDFAAKNGIRSLFALTSQADFIVHHLRNLMGIRFSMFKKENLNTPDQWKVLSDVLYEACKYTVKLRGDMPKSKQWTNEINEKSYKQLYIDMWNADSRDEFFFSIEEKCNEVWKYILEEKDHNYKNIHLIKEKFNIEIPKSELDLFPVLVLRRIWMALWYLKVDKIDRLSRESVTETINWVYQVICTGMSHKYDGNHANVEQNKLCLKTKEIQEKKMLPEEKDWLIKQNLIEAK